MIFASRGESDIAVAKDIMKDIDTNSNSVSQTLEEYNLTDSSTSSTQIEIGSSLLSVSKTINAKWNGGFCDNIIISNPTNTDILWNIEILVDGDIYTLWNAEYTQDANSKILTATGVEWNKIAKANSSSEFGYCANSLSDNTPTTPSAGQSNFGKSDYAQVLNRS